MTKNLKKSRSAGGMMPLEEARARAKEAEEAGNLELASRWYKKVIELAPEAPSFWLQYADCELELGRKGNAEKAMLRAQHLAPEQSLVQRVVGRMQSRLGKLALAEQSLKRSIEIEPSARTYIYLHNTLIQQGRDREAENAIKCALELEPDNEEAHYNLGFFYKLDQRLDLDQRADLAERHFRRAIEIDPEYSIALAELGNILARKGQYVEAENLLKKSIHLNPQRFWSRIYLAEIYRELGNLRKADAEFKEAFRIRPGDAFALSLYGDFLSQDKEEHERGERYLREALSKEPDYPTFQFFLGRSLLHQDREAEARGFLRQAADNDHPGAKRLLEQLDRESTD